MKKPDILNDPKYKHLSDIIRENKVQFYAAREIAYIYRFYDGETELKELFSQVNYDLISNLLNNLKEK